MNYSFTLRRFITYLQLRNKWKIRYRDVQPIPKESKKEGTEETALIPDGIYCYDYNNKQLCPYWREDELHPRSLFPSEHGYCAFLHKSDFDINEEPVAYRLVTVTKPNGEKRKLRFVGDTPHSFGDKLSMLWDWMKACDIKYHP